MFVIVFMTCFKSQHMDSADIEHVRHHRNFYWTASL